MSRKTNLKAAPSDNSARKYHKQVFDNIPTEKRERILTSAASEFALKGFEKARVSDIAQKAGVSHGSIYTYFNTKDDILRHLIEEITELQEEGFEIENDLKDGFYLQLQTILSRSFQVAEKRPYLMSTWLSLSFEYNSRFYIQIKEIEESGVRIWQRLLKEAVARGEITHSTDIQTSAFIIDSIIANILRSYISEHEKLKLTYHFGSDFKKEEVIDKIVKVIMNLLK